MDIEGAWASDVSQCHKVFSKRRESIVFSNVADAHGGGFIIEGDRIRGRVARCRVKSRTNGDATIHLIASCADDILLSDVQMSLKVIGQNKIARIFPGVGDIEVSYERCTFD